MDPQVRMSSWVNFILVGFLVFFDGGQCISTPSPKTIYVVNVTTSPELNAEPASGDKVSIKITGEKGATDFKELRRVVNSFAKGNESEFSVTARDVGKIVEIIINKTATGNAEAWKMKKLKIEDSKGTIYEFICNCWFSVNSGLQKTLKVSNVIPPTATSFQSKPTSPSSSSVTSGATSPIATATSSSESTATPTTGEESTKAIPAYLNITVEVNATSTKPTSPAGAASGPTSSKPSGSSPSTSSGPTSKPSASSATSLASSGSSPQPTSGSSTKAASGPTSANSPGPTSKPTSSANSPGPTSKSTSSSASPSGSVSATNPTSAKVTASSGAISSKPTSNQTSTALTSVQPSGSSSVKPSGIPSKRPSSKGIASTGSKSPTPASKPTEATTPTSVQTSGSSSVKPSGQPSKPTSSSVTEPTGAKSTPNTMPTTGPTSEVSTSSNPTVATSAKPNPPKQAKPTGPTSSKNSAPTSAKSSSPSSSVKHSAATSAKTSRPTSSKPSGSSGATIIPSSSPTSSGSSTAKPSGSSKSSTSSSGPSASPTQSTAVTSPVNSSSVPTTGTTPAQANAAFMNDILNQINTIRLVHGAGPLLLEKNMSQAAQKKASTLSKRETVNDEIENTYGISTCKLAGATPGKNAAKQCVSRWYETVKNFDWPNPKVTSKSAQFARLVWKPTTHVGIGVAGTNVVVYFDPASNEMESAKDNISPVIELSDGTNQVCPEGFRISGKSCFKFNPAPSTWAKAIEQCAQHGATLASIQSQQENTFVTGMVSGSQNSDTSEAWLGFNDRIMESRYQWVDGSVVQFHHFLQSEPTGVGQNCVALKNTKNETGWEDRKCSDKLPSLCRRPAEGPITYKITFLIEVSIDDQNATRKTLIPPVGGKDHATLIKEKLNSTSSKKPIEFVGESTQTGPDSSTYFSVFVKVPPVSKPSIVQPLQNYLDNHNNHIYPGSKEKVFVVSVTFNNPADGMCYSSCFTTCSNQCSPMCCSGTFIINPSAQSQASPPYQQQTQQPVYNYHNTYQQSSSYPSSYLPNYASSFPYPQQNSLSSPNPYMVPSTMGCARACTRITKNDFCPAYCPKRCCRARLYRPWFFRPRLIIQPQLYN